MARIFVGLIVTAMIVAVHDFSIAETQNVSKAIEPTGKSDRLEIAISLNPKLVLEQREVRLSKLYLADSSTAGHNAALTCRSGDVIGS